MITASLLAAALMSCSAAIAERDQLTPLYIAAVAAEQDRAVAEALGVSNLRSAPVLRRLTALYARIEGCDQ